ncbi:MAG: hypothetical protein KYX69_11290 [Sphingomonas sp.]|uniref:hypothetical protein n=1 Tax=Sphingomonas sp. TaxID=28214 RepID=UPI002611631B|nr:hypothetical protein [Sphingomonas sp.]MDK2768289.1 hypothetical protein [Sphingomonas sp.]
MTPSSMDAARAIIARVRSIEALLKDEEFLSQMEWRMLPVAKQDIVLRRLCALRDYDRLDTPTTVDALKAAKAAGVAIARFYQLLSHWRANDRSPFSLVPHQSLGAERPTRLAAGETAKAITASIAELLRTDPLAATGRVIAHVRRTWKGPGELPTDTALRAFHERVIRSARPVPGTLTLSTPGQPLEEDVVAERLGETLVIDHVAIKGLVAQEDGLQPTVTLAIDLWSGSALGAAALAGPPSPHGLILALEEVSRRLARPGRAGFHGDLPSGPKPRLVIATTFARRWSGMVDALLAAGHEVVERRDVFLQQGGPARRLLGMRLGSLDLARRADRRKPFNPRTTAVQPMYSIQEILGECIEEMVDQRVPADAWAAVLPFDTSKLRETGPWDEASEGGHPDAAASASTSEEREVRRELEALAATHTPGGAHAVRIGRRRDGAWHMTVTVADPAARDSTFIELARRAMRLSAEHGVPIVVDVETNT